MSMDVEAVERALLTANWDDQLDSEGAPAVVGLAKNVVEGAFRDPLTSAAARALFTVNEPIADKSLADWFSFRTHDDLSATDELLRLTLAVACLWAFLQVNWTGPDLDFKPLEVVSIPEGSSSGDITEELLQQKSIVELAYGGEPAYHLAEHLVLLRLAILLFNLPYSHCSTIAWWRLRAWNAHLQVLDEPVAPPGDVFPSTETLVEKLLPSHQDLAGSLLLEKGLLQHTLGQEKAAGKYFVRAARATQLEYELSGALGKRTKWQQNDITQLVLLAESRKRNDDPEPEQEVEKPAPENGSSTDGTHNGTAIPETLALNDDTLLEKTEFTSSTAAAPGSRLAHIDPSSQPALHPLDQSILLALCLNISNTSPSHGLTAEQMKSYVARVLAHPRNWSVHTMALLLRSRLEAHRTRTVERATLQLQALVQQMPTADSTPRERLAYLHALPLPSKWALEKELARSFASLGVLRSALEIFERREMWEDVVRCWQSMERPDKAIAIVRDLLAGRKAEADAVLLAGKDVPARRRQTLDALREATLWCLLGELEPTSALEHFTKAWEVSGRTSSRAMRSLGGYHFARGDHPNTVECLRRAVAINPLLSRSWFILGCACTRLEDWDGAREAFVRCVTIDDEDGESWNNLASVYLRMQDAVIKTSDADDDETDKPTEAQAGLLDNSQRRIPFANKQLAFRALQQGVKHAYENWRMWANYAVVALDAGEPGEAARALGRVVELRAAKDGADAVDEDVLDRLVDAATRSPVEGLARRVEDLLERVILPRVSSPRIFRARARLLGGQGRWADALQAHMDAYRCGVAVSLEPGGADVERWREGVREVEDVVEVLKNLGPHVEEEGGEGKKWRGQARSVLRTFMGRSKEFADEPEWTRLEALLKEVRRE